MPFSVDVMAATCHKALGRGSSAVQLDDTLDRAREFEVVSESCLVIVPWSSMEC